MPKQHYDSEIASRLRNARKEKGYSQEKLAEKASVSTRELVRIEKAEVEPAMITIARLADALGITLAELCTGEGNADLAVKAGRLDLLIENCSWKERRFILGLVQYVADNIKDLES